MEGLTSGHAHAQEHTSPCHQPMLSATGPNHYLRGTWKPMLKDVHFLVLHLTKESIQFGQVFCKAEFWLLRQSINVQARIFSCMCVFSCSL